jgi:hypothetical protein
MRDEYSKSFHEKTAPPKNIEDEKDEFPALEIVSGES